MPLHPGEKLGPYEILAPVGKGGMGEVYKALDKRLDRIVAIKVSKTEFSERFEREARAVAALNHPYICTLYDIGPDYLVMELVEGKPLKGPLPPEEALRYAAQICDALDHAHHKGVVHRDLKPANILVTRQGVKLLDFGLARITPGPEGPTLTELTREGGVMGTPGYMAPEQWEGKHGDARSDIFAFGCVLYEMLTGRRATPEREALDSTGLESVVKTCLAKDPEERWQSAGDIKRALALWATAQTAAGNPRRRLAWTASVAALVFAALAGWAFLHSSPGGRDDPQAYRFQIVLPRDAVVAPGFSNTLALSADGRMVAFVLESNRKTGVWIQDLKGTSPRLLPGSEGAVFVLWSPDSKSVAFRVADQLFRFDLSSSAPVAIAPLPTGPIFGADWGADGAGAGTIIVAAPRGLMRVPASGGTPVEVAVADASAGISFPYILPEGRFLYTPSAKPGVFGALLDRPEQPVQILKENAAPFYAANGIDKGYGEKTSGGYGHLVWIRGTTLLAQEFDPKTLRVSGEPIVIADPAWNVAVSPSLLIYDSAPPATQLAWVDRDGKVQQTVGDPGQFAFTALSPDGGQLATSIAPTAGTPDVNLWMLDTHRGVINRVSTLPGSHLSPAWSPDGRIVMFGSPTGLGRIAANGVGEEEHILPKTRLQNPSDWSPKGFVLFVELRLESGTGIDLMMVPVTPDGKTAGPVKPYVAKPKDQQEGRFSPDGDWVAYQSNESGPAEIFIDTFPEPHGAIQISTGGGFGPRWNPRGGELVYRSLDGKLMAVSIRLDKTSAVPSAPRALFTLPVNPIPGQGSIYNVGPDGKRFLIEIPVKKPPLDVIVNWQALLKDKATK